MKYFRRKFLKNVFISLSILPFIQFKLFFLEKGELKLKKNKKFIWYLNNED